MCRSFSAATSSKCLHVDEATVSHQAAGLSGRVQLLFQLGQGRSSQGPCLEPATWRLKLGFKKKKTDHEHLISFEMIFLEAQIYVQIHVYIISKSFKICSS